MAWDRIRQSQSVVVLEAFAKQFPGAAEATERIADLKRAGGEQQRVALLQKQDEDKKRAEAAAAAKAAEDRRKAAEEAARRNPAAGVTPGSGQRFRDTLADGSDCPFCPELVVVPAGTRDRRVMSLPAGCERRGRRRRG